LVKHGEDAKPSDGQIAQWVETLTTYDTAKMKKMVGRQRAKLKDNGGRVKAIEMIEAKTQKAELKEQKEQRELQVRAPRLSCPASSPLCSMEWPPASAGRREGSEGCREACASAPRQAAWCKSGSAKEAVSCRHAA
jgi:hypothetical protein